MFIKISLKAAVTIKRFNVACNRIYIDMHGDMRSNASPTTFHCRHASVRALVLLCIVLRCCLGHSNAHSTRIKIVVFAVPTIHKHIVVNINKAKHACAAEQIKSTNAHTHTYSAHAHGGSQLHSPKEQQMCCARLPHKPRSTGSHIAGGEYMAYT